MSRRRRPAVIWLRNDAGGWNVAILGTGEKPEGLVTVVCRNGRTSLETLGACVGTRIFRHKTYTLYVANSTAHPYRQQRVPRLYHANALGWLNAISPHY